MASFMDALRQATKEQLAATAKRNEPKPISPKSPFQRKRADQTKRSRKGGPGRNKMPVELADGEDTDTKLTVRMSPKKKDALMCAAADMKVSVSHLVRLALDAYLQQEGYEG